MDDELTTAAVGVDATVATRAWTEWVSPERQRAEARRFLDFAAGSTELPDYPWAEDAPELRQLDAYCARVFPDMPTAMAAPNAEVADQCICLIGVLFIRFAGARWEPYQWFGRECSFYDEINPLLDYPFTEEGDTAWGLMGLLVKYGFSSVAGLLREYSERRDFDI
ncbi:hypothetical protein ACFU44_17460 [Nocardia rhizosphaerihabitans]|uniref:hypothetical protein n=1 Tax=Nocardia rhizosphaerihabitans TaxID=1691570 RepID=UPI00366EF234